MPSSKEFKKKIRTTANTRKITSTMEMVATARSKRAQNRVQATTPYSNKLSEILSSLAAAGTVSHPLLTPAEKVERSILLVVTGNRGLCGGYNTNVLSQAEKWMAREQQAGRETDLYMIGRKGITRCRFLKIQPTESYTHIEDRPSFVEAQEIAEIFMRRFLSGEVGRVVILSTRYFSSSQQRAVETQLLPIIPAEIEGEEAKDESTDGSGADFIFEPDRSTILEALLPQSVSQALYRIFLEAAVSEQIARRVAMKLATDNAEEMIKTYTRLYNRQRQAGITQQITEIVTGAQALE